MIDICRLCLSPNNKVRNLFKNNEITLKIKKCFQVEIAHEEDLPDQICEECVDRIDSIYKFLLTIIENQNILYDHLNQGNDHIKKFYSILKNIKVDLDVENKDIEETKEQDDVLKNLKTENNDDLNIKVELEKIYEEEDYGSDDDIALIAFKDTKENDVNNIKKEKNYSNTKKLKTPKKINNKQLQHTIELVEYKCLICAEIVDSYQNLKEHYKIKHKPSSLPKFDKDNFTMSKINNKMQFTCNLCKKFYNNRKQVRAHLEAHQEMRPYVCNICGRKYKNIIDIMKHTRAHSGVKLFCKFNCGYSSVYIHCVHSHERRHKDEFKYKCEKCGKGFEAKTHYEEHQYHHTGDKPFICNICGHAFSYSRYLNLHQRESHPESQESETNKGRFACLHCSLSYNYKIQLIRHLAMQHGLKQEFLCHTCGKSFKTAKTLYSHSLYHGDKKFTCSTCNKSFTTNDHLKRHSHIHTGYKKHGCAECGKHYRDKKNLIIHLSRVHSAKGKNKKIK